MTSNARSRGNHGGAWQSGYNRLVSSRTWNGFKEHGFALLLITDLNPKVGKIMAATFKSSRKHSPKGNYCTYVVGPTTP